MSKHTVVDIKNTKMIEGELYAPFIGLNGLNEVILKSIIDNAINITENLNKEVCLSAVSLLTLPLTTTPQVVKTEVKKVESNISYNALTGELTFLKDCSCGISTVAKIDCTQWDKIMEMWIEKWNGTQWVIVPDTGFSREFQNQQETEVRYEFASKFLNGDKFRVMAKSDTNGVISLVTKTLSNSVKMPSFRISIYGR